MSKVLQNVRKFWLNEIEAITCIMLMLIVIGTINICSASLITAYTDFENPYYFLLRHLASVVVGSILFFLVSRKVNYKLFKKYAIPLLFIVMALLLLVLFVGVEVNGSRRWIMLPAMQFQPSELAKFAAIILCATYLGQCIDNGVRITLNPLKNRTLPLCVLMFILVELEPDMGTAMIILGIPIIMHMVAGLSPKYILVMLGICAAGLAAVATLQPYRLMRIQSWFDPWSDTQGAGYQIVQSILAIGSGKIYGMGLGHGFSKYSYLPESHTDFAFAVYCQETGFIGAMLVFILILAFAFYCVRIAVRTRDGFGKMLVIGFMLLIVCQAAGNMAMVIGLIPVVGVPMPFISYGGTSLILNMLSIAFIISVARTAPPPVKKVISAPHIEKTVITTTDAYPAKNGKAPYLRRVK